MNKHEPYTCEQLQQGKFQIISTIHKLKETLKTLQSKENPKRYASQITLAQRRIDAFELSLIFFNEKISELQCEV